MRLILTLTQGVRNGLPSGLGQDACLGPSLAPNLEPFRLSHRRRRGLDVRRFLVP